MADGSQIHPNTQCATSCMSSPVYLLHNFDISWNILYISYFSVVQNISQLQKRFDNDCSQIDQNTFCTSSCISTVLCTMCIYCTSLESKVYGTSWCNLGTSVVFSLSVLFII